MKIIVDGIPIQCYVRQNFTLLLLNELLLQRSYGLILAAKSAFIISDAILFIVLNKSASGACIFLLWIETKLSFFMIYHRMLFLTLSYKECISLLRPLLRLKDSTQIEILQILS